MRKAVAALSVVLIVTISQGCQSRSREAAHLLLDQYFENSLSIKETAASKTRVLDELEKNARALKGQIPDEFSKRYLRLVDMTRLSIATNMDAQARQQLADYIESITGAAPPKGDSSFDASIQFLRGAPSRLDFNLIASSAFAFNEEMLRLDMLLDGETDREKVRAKYAEKFRARRKLQSGAK
jgi:hypothetical protein